MQILNRTEDKLLVIARPCSIDSPGAALKYAGRLARIRVELKDDLCLGNAWTSSLLGGVDNDG